MYKNRSFGQKLILFTTIMLFISSAIVGGCSYLVARNALIEKGKTILQNGVKSALILIDEMNKDVENGSITLEEAQENIKLHLLGPLNEDGTRQINSPVDFGENGYYIIYSTSGVEIMHPNLEGENVWHFKDKANKNRPFYLVQDKIKKAQSGGGFTEYTWEYPNSNELGKKIVYSELDPNWGWVVTAGSYISDFDKAALIILQITVITMIAVIILGFLFARVYINSITKPLTVVVDAMKSVEEGSYGIVPQFEVYDEIGNLIHGFNTMVQAIDTAQKDLIQKDDQLLQYAYYDQLSGLPNSYYFKKHVSERLAHLNNNAAMLLIDIKDFNIINSIYSTTYGDEIIAHLGKKAIDMKSDDSFVARIGGNEFVVWIEDVNENQISDILSNILEEFKLSLRASKFINHIDFYTSLVIVDSTNLDFEDIYKKASTALQYSKSSKNMEITKYEDEMYVQLEKESKITSLAEFAIHSNEFLVYYQEKVDVTTQKVVGVESLSRWYSKELGFVSPAEFIPVLHKSNLMILFTNMVLRKVVDDIEKIYSLYGEDVSVSINISPISFFSDNFVSSLQSLIESSKIKASSIVLEITEDVFISDFEVLQAKILELKNLGDKISLDDFGTGYSSLNYLSKIQFDEIKVDKSFVDNVHLDETAYSLFDAIVKIAKSLNCNVVAEGVETAEQVKVIEKSGCNIIQGYIYSKPKPL